MVRRPLLSVEDLSVNYYTLEGVIKAVRNVSFHVDKGEVLCLVGESGSGKSTIGLAVADALPDNAEVARGRIIFEGRELLKLSEDERRRIRGKEISVIFQDPAASLNPLFTIGEQLSDVMKVHLGIKNKEELRRMALEKLKTVGLPDPERVYNAYPHELSGGMMQRAVIAIALSTGTKLLVADEPTTMLDVTLQAQILDLLAYLRRKFDLSVLFITHNLGVAAEVADRVLVVYAGVEVEEGNIDEILEEPFHPYTRSLIRCVPRGHRRESRLEFIPGSLPDLRNPPPGCPFHPRCEETMEVCRKKIPPIVTVGEGHRVACWLYSGEKS